MMVRDIKWSEIPDSWAERIPVYRRGNRIRQQADRERVEVRAIIIEDGAIIGGSR